MCDLSHLALDLAGSGLDLELNPIELLENGEGVAPMQVHITGRSRSDP